MIRRIMPILFALAAAGALLPADARSQVVHAKGIDSLNVKANVQVQFNTTSVDDEPSSEWLMRRARLGLRGWIAGWIRGDIEGDFGRGGAKLTDGYVTLAFSPAFTIRVGQYKKPFDALELISSRQLLVAEREGTPRGADGPTPDGLVDDLGYSNRDIGVEWDGRSGRLGWAAGLWNGSGENESEDDDGKQVAGRLNVEVVPGWTVSGAWTGKRISEPPDAEDATWYDAVELAVTGGEYAEPGWKALGQLMAGDNWDPDLGGGDDASFLAVQGIVGYHVPLFTTPWLIGVEPIVRLGWTDPDTDFDDDQALLATPGVNLYFHEHVKTQVQADFLSPGEGDSEVALRIHTVLEF
ncbi:MAG: porin [Gemmatimonadota bacterium]